MGKAEYFESFKQNADEFICSILPGISHPQVQYSRGNNKTIIFLFSQYQSTPYFFSTLHVIYFCLFLPKVKCIGLISNSIKLLTFFFVLHRRTACENWRE